MKKWTFLLLLFLSNSGFCQISNNSIVNSNVIWAGMDIGSSGEIDYVQSYYTRFNGDTIIDNINYSKVWKCTDSLAVDWNLVGLIQEQNKKVVFRRLDSENDLLLYDFSCGFGDTIVVNYVDFPNISVSMKVVNIDSIYVLGTKKLRVQLNEIHSPFTETWIEKIGSLEGILNSCFSSAGSRSLLLCAHENGNRIYSHKDYPNCFYTLSSIKTETPPANMEKVLVYPNPFTNNININSQVAFQKVEIINIYGQCVFKKIYSSDIRNDTYTLPNLISGIYIIKISLNERETILVKLINRVE